MVVRQINGALYVDFTIPLADGTRKRVRRKSPVQRKRDAEMFGRALMREELELSSGRKRRTNRRYEDFVVDYLVRHVDVHHKFSTKRKYRTTLECHVLPYFADHKLSEITGAELARFQSHLVTNSGLAPSTIRDILFTVTGSLRVAERWGEIEKTPKVKVLKRKRQKQSRFLTDEDSAKLVEAATPFWRPMISVALLTGLRIGELCALRWEEVDLEGGMLHVRRAVYRGVMGTPKHDRERSVALSPGAIETLRTLRAQGNGKGVVFATLKGEIRNDRTCDGRIRRAAKKAGLKPFGWHVLRHTFGSQLAMRGVPIPAIQKLLGHANIQTTMRYAHLLPATLEHSVSLLDEPLAVALAARAGQHPGIGPRGGQPTSLLTQENPQ